MKDLIYRSCTASFCLDYCDSYLLYTVCLLVSGMRIDNKLRYRWDWSVFNKLLVIIICRPKHAVHTRYIEIFYKIHCGLTFRWRRTGSTNHLLYNNILQSHILSLDLQCYSRVSRQTLLMPGLS